MNYIFLQNSMKSINLESALQKIPNPEILVNIVSRRVRQLVQGQRPLVVVDSRMEPMDIALREIAEGKIGYELATASNDNVA